MDKYTRLTSIHIFCPFAIKTAGAWHETAIEVTQEIGRHITAVTEDTREIRVPISTPVHGSATRERGLLPKHYDHRMKCRCSHLLCLASIFLPAALCLWA